MSKQFLIACVLLPSILLSQDNTTDVEVFLVKLMAQAKEQVSLNGSPEQVDFKRYIKAWAQKNDLAPSDAEKRIRDWVAAAKSDTSDVYKLGLAYFYEHKFSLAATHLNDAVAQKSNRIVTLVKDGKSESEQAKTLLLQGIRELRLVGHAFYCNYEFDSALKDYLRALEFIPSKTEKKLWAETLLDLGQTYSEVAGRIRAPKNQKILQNAVKSFTGALQVFTKESDPQQWAKAQNRLGATLAIMGINFTGANNDSLLKAGITSLENSLTVFTKESAPEYWSKIQNNLGASLSELAIRTEKDESAELLQRAILAYQNALQYRTLESSPTEWANTHGNLAAAYFYLNQWEKVADSYMKVLEVYPEDKTAYQTAGELYQKVLFEFDKAFELNKKWVDAHPDDLLEKVKLVEKYFTTAQFERCEKEIQAFKNNPDYSALVHVVMMVLQIPSSIALGNQQAVPTHIDVLIAELKKQNPEFKIDVNWAGVAHFVKQHQRTSKYGDWLSQLFEVAGREARDQIIAGLENSKNTFTVN